MALVVARSILWMTDGITMNMPLITVKDMMRDANGAAKMTGGIGMTGTAGEEAMIEINLC